MPKDQIDDDDLTGDKELATIARKLSLNPKTRDRFLDLVAEENPDLPIPEVKMKKDIQAATAPLLSEIAEMKKKDEKRDREAAWDARRKPLRDRGYNDAQIAEVEKFMTEKQIFDHAIAADVYERNQKTAAPTTSYTAVELPTTEALLKNPAKWATDEAHKAVDELRAAR